MTVTIRNLGPPAGTLDQRITIQTRVITRDERGQESDSWGGDITVWAKATQASGREYQAANASQSVDLVNFVVRYRDMPSQFRVLWKGRAYDPAQPPADVEGGRHSTLLLCAGGKPT